MAAFNVESLYSLWERSTDYDFTYELAKAFGHVSPSTFASEWSWNIPQFDPAGTNFARDRADLAYKEAYDVIDLANKQTEQVYDTQLGDIRSEYEDVTKKLKTVTGSIGLRSGELEDATGTSYEDIVSDIESLENKFDLDQEEDDLTLETTLSDATLDFHDAVHDEKEKWYNAVMKQMERAAQQGAFDEAVEYCWDGSRADEHADETCPEEETITTLFDDDEDPNYDMVNLTMISDDDNFIVDAWSTHPAGEGMNFCDPEIRGGGSAGVACTIFYDKLIAKHGMHDIRNQIINERCVQGTVSRSEETGELEYYANEKSEVNCDE